MPILKVYDPAMCCSSGVCGPQVDPALVRFSADLKWLKSKGVTVERYNLGQEPQAFVANPLVRAEIAKDVNVLPLIVVDGEIVSSRIYPDRGELAEMLGVEAPPVPQLLNVIQG